MPFSGAGISRKDRSKTTSEGEGSGLTWFGTLWCGLLLGTSPLHCTKVSTWIPPCGRPNLLIQDVREPRVGPFVFQGSFFGHLVLVLVLGGLLKTPDLIWGQEGDETRCVSCWQWCLGVMLGKQSNCVAG